MKKEITPPSSKGLLITYHVILAAGIALLLALAAGSLYAIIRPANARPLFRIGGRKQAAPVAVSDTVNIFSGIGRLRIPLAHNTAATVIISISFPYPADDRAFAEELASRIGDFRSIATAYFASLPPEKIAALDEEAAKKEILGRYNGLLRLGKIEALYFGDLMVIE